MVYYRKYRPQTIEDLDSKQVREKLTAILASENIPHAFLFTGPKGLGKTSTARIIAKIINCTKRKKGSIDPCNTCDSCVSITNGSNMDVLEIDGASNRGIDEMRDLRDKVKLAPSNAKKKIYIIDEVHMLTTEAFNALLKTIEEPPAHVMFMFCTTEPQKVPATILSRCFHIGFPKASEEDIVHSLERIVQGEKLDIEKEALQQIAQLADGGFRDAAKILEEIVALSANKKITKAFLDEHYQTSNIILHVEKLLGLMHEKKTKESLELVEQVTNQGTEPKLFLAEILDTLHKKMLAGFHIEGFSDEKNILDMQSLDYLVGLFSKAYQDSKYAVIAQLPLELAIVTWCDSSSEEVEEQSAEIIVTKTPKGPSLNDVRKKEQTLRVKGIIEGKKEEKTKVIASVAQGALKSDIDQMASLMENIIYKVKPFNHSLAGVLRGCVIQKFDETELVFQTAYKFHQERLMDNKSREILEQVIREITGKQIKVLVELKG